MVFHNMSIFFIAIDIVTSLRYCRLPFANIVAYYIEAYNAVVGNIAGYKISDHTIDKLKITKL